MADIVIGNAETLVSVPTELVIYLFVSDTKFQHSCTLRLRKPLNSPVRSGRFYHSNLMKRNMCVCTLNKLTHTHVSLTLQKDKSVYDSKPSFAIRP